MHDALIKAELLIEDKQKLIRRGRRKVFNESLMLDDPTESFRLRFMQKEGLEEQVYVQAKGNGCETKVDISPKINKTN